MTTPPNLQRLRYAVRGALVLGLTASVIANVLHAEPNPISKVIAGWPPVALWIAIELVIHVPVDRPKLAWLRRAGTLLIAGIAAYVSYWHMAGVAERYGESGLSVFLLPLSVDGLIAVASICLVEISGRLRAESMPEKRETRAPRSSGRVSGSLPRSSTPLAPTTVAQPHPVKAIEPAPNEEARNGHDRPQTVAAAVRDAWDLLGDNPEAIYAKVKTIHHGVSEETVRRNINRIRKALTNGHVHV